MLKRLLLVAPLALALAACGSSGNQNAPMTPPAAPATAPQATPGMSAAPAATVTTAVPTTTAPPVAAPAAAGSAASGATRGAAATTNSNNLSAADRAAMAKAAKNFVDNGQWVEGKDYFLIQPQQPKVTNTDKVEVVEVFNWGCPACNEAHKAIDMIAAKLPSYATMAYLPAGFNPQENWVLYQRTWYTAKALGIARKSYDAMFDANWKTGETGSYNLATGTLNPRSKWPDIHTIAKFYNEKYGVPTKQFVAVANSFAINTKIKRADELVKAYGVPATPTMVIDGRYRFTFTDVGTYQKGLELAQWLVAKEAKRLTSEANAGQ